MGDRIEMPFLVGTKSGDFSYTDYRYANSFSDYYHGLIYSDVFYEFTLSVPMNVTITHEGSYASDTYMSLLDSNGNLIESNDNYSGEGHCTNTYHSFIRRQLDAGTYYVVSECYTNYGYIRTNITGNASSDFNYPTIPSTYSTSPSTFVGGMGGQFSVSPMGGATYSIPIDVPPGVGGLQPQLAIVYNSQSGNGLCGYGASLSGISAITRGPKDIYHDGTAQGINYQTVDVLYLDGVRLILDPSSTAGQNGAMYYPESDPFTRVIEHNAYPSSNNDTWFEVQSSNGMVYEYGHDSGSRLSYTTVNSNRIHSWYISHAQQPTGNYMIYRYQQDNYCVYPHQITYGSNINQQSTQIDTVSFTYEDRSDSVLIRFDGKHGRMGRRLRTITGSTSGSTYRKYTLNYNTTGDGTEYKFSRLASVSEENGQNESLPATRLDWSYLPALNYSSGNLTVNNPANLLSNVTYNFYKQSYMTGDLNGDAIPEIIGIGPAGNQTIAEVFYGSVNDGSITYSTTGQSGNYWTTQDTGVFMNVGVTYERERSIIDLDGDGINELLLCHYDGVYNDYGRIFLEVYGQNTGYGLYTLPLSGPSLPIVTVGDVFNDGRPKILVLETQQNNYGYYKLHFLEYNKQRVSPNDSILSYYSFKNLSFQNDPKQMSLSDLNGNGLMDLLVVFEQNYKIYWGRGQLFYSENYSVTGSNIRNYDTMINGDFNGDGLMDFVMNSKGSKRYNLILNNGDGTFSSPLSFDINDVDFYDSTVQDENSLIMTIQSQDQCNFNVLDFDADGKSDIVISKTFGLVYLYPYLGQLVPIDMGVTGQTTTKWLSSNGTSFTAVQSAKYYGKENCLDILVDDFNGDGIPEVVNFGNNRSRNSIQDSDTVHCWRIYGNNNLTTQRGKITSVTGDNGVTTNITYTTLTDQDIYTRGTDDPYPAPQYTIPLNVVKQTVQNNGAAGSLTTQYSYSGLKIHLRGRGLLGFCRTTADCITTGISTESGVTQWDTDFYIPRASYTKTTIGIDTAKTETILNIEDMGNRKYFAYPSFSISRDMDGNLTYNYWSFNTVKGYIESKSTVYGTEMCRSVSYQNYTESKVGGVYRPQRVVTSQQHPDDESLAPVFSVTTTYTYDNTTGAVTTKVENYGTSKPLTTSYTYDAWGNLTSQLSTGSGVTSCTTYYTYDQTHRFPVRIYTSPASSVMKYTYDVFGNVLTEQDSINSSINSTITHTYNAWGQLIRTDMPGGTYTTYTRGWNNNAGKRYFILSQGTATPWVKTWYDNHGREVMTESIGLMNVSVSSTTTYNSKGLAVSHTETSGNLTLTRSYTYDSRGRVVTETAPGNAVTTYQYGNRYVTVTENSRTTTTTYDAWGNVKTVTAPVSSISNTYASNGGIKQTVAGGATWTFQYDDRGNRTSMTDPDAGTTTYVYDAFGRETSRTDGRGIVFETKYDYLGRVTQRKAGTDAINYTYWTSGNGQLSLKSESNGTWTKSYVYDNLRRVTTETMTNGTVTKTRTYQYGTNGLLSQRTVPGSKTYVYTYDAYGNLTGVDFGNGIVEWSLTGYTGKNTVSETVLNGYIDPFVKTTALDGNGMPDYLMTVQDGNYYQYDDLTFSAQTGNLTSRNNYTSYYSQSYNYDNADRLTGIQQNNQTIMSMTYSANGNITSKTGMGSYTYSTASRPHAVTEVDNTAGLLDMNDQSVSYDSWGKVSSVWQTDNTDFYYHIIDYGPDLKRVTSVTDKTYNTLYEKFYWDDYEEKTVGDDFLQYYYVYGGDGLAGLYLVDTNPHHETSSHATKVITDHLGSITELRDNVALYFKADYDAWGRRTVMAEYDLDPYFDRGYTGHEHLLEEFGLINMNGRMYDPNLGRFLSPDNYIQSPGNPQNYNRYSYCLNNPLKYTDPDGEFFTALAAICCPALIPIGISMDIGWMSGAHKSTYYPDVSKFQGACRGAISGAIGGVLSYVGGGSLVCNVLWGSAQGAITGAIDAKLWGEDVGDAALYGAIMGGAFASFSSIHEAALNKNEGYGFRTNEGVMRSLLKKEKYAQAIDYFRIKNDMLYGNDGQYIVMEYDPRYEGSAWGYTSKETGYSSIYQNATKNLRRFKATIVHEYAHAKIDRYINSDGFYDWKYKPEITLDHGVLNLYDGAGYKGDGVCGYGNEILNAGRAHLSIGYFLNFHNNDLFPVWLLKRGWWEWYCLLPTRYNFGVNIRPY
ncbi:MAG: VCBS repeat-containing protein [Bacteroidaceae bacterium]|nr:VCBS repeat-containing protein [Bacteroidaceae bacterium]